MANTRPYSDVVTDQVQAFTCLRVCTSPATESRRFQPYCPRKIALRHGSARCERPPFGCGQRTARFRHWGFYAEPETTTVRQTAPARVAQAPAEYDFLARRPAKPMLGCYCKRAPGGHARTDSSSSRPRFGQFAPIRSRTLVQAQPMSASCRCASISFQDVRFA